MTALPRPPYSSAFFAALCDQIRSDVLDTVVVLEGMGFPRCLPKGGRKLPDFHLPREFLHGILIGVRLLRWEQDGIMIHREAGLPGAQEHVNRVAQLFSGPELCEYVTDLEAQARMLFYEHFAWSGREDLHAEVGIIAEDGEEFLDRLADFIWDHRHALPHGSDEHEKATE